MKTTELNFFQKMFIYLSYKVKVTKFQQPLLITLEVADEKPEGAKTTTLIQILI